MDWEELLTGRIRRMSHVRRHSSIPVLRGENVAEHSWYAAMYCLVIAKDLKSFGEKYALIDTGELLQSALVHDIDEHATGDILRTVKHANTKVLDGIVEFAKEAVEDLSFCLGWPSLTGVWEDAKDSSLEGQILALVDVACVAAYMIEERGFGNRHVLPICRQVWNLLRLISEGHYKKVQDPLLISRHARMVFKTFDLAIRSHEPDWSEYKGVKDPLYDRTINLTTHSNDDSRRSGTDLRGTVGGTRD